MKRGNPYHDSRGRFCSAGGRSGFDQSDIDRQTETLTEHYTERYFEPSEGTPYTTESHGESFYDDEAIEEQRDDFKANVYSEMEYAVSGYMATFDDHMTEKYKNADIESIEDYDFGNGQEKAFGEACEKAGQENVSDYDIESDLAISACEDWDDQVVDIRKRRLVYKMGKRELKAYAEKEKANGLLTPWATKRVEELGL